jgi:hypothetical protein
MEFEQSRKEELQADERRMRWEKRARQHEFHEVIQSSKGVESLREERELPFYERKNAS